MCVKQLHSSDSSHFLFPDDPLSSSYILIFLWWQWSLYLVLFDCCVNSPVYLSSCPLVHPPPHLSSLHLQPFLRPHLLLVCYAPCFLFVAGFVFYISRSPLVLSSLTLCSSSSCHSSPHSRVSRLLPVLNSRGRR